MIRHLFSSITCSNPRRLLKPSVWNGLANLLNLFPFLCLAYIVSCIYDYYTSEALHKNSLWMAWGLMVVCFILTYIFENIACKVTYRDGFMASAEGRIKLAEHIRKLPLGFLTSKDSGTIGNTMMNDISRTESSMTHVLPQIISGVLVAVLTSAAMLIADWRMGLAMFSGFPIALLIMFGMKKLEKGLDTQLAAARIEQANKLQEYLFGMRIIKSYNMQGKNFVKLDKACTDYRDACIKVEGSIGPLNLVSAAFLRSGLSLMTIVGVYLIAGGSLDVPEFALFLLVGTRVFDPLAVAIMNYSELMMGQMAGERIIDLLEEPEMSGSKEAPTSHEICFENVTFGYDKEDVLHDITVQLKPGTLTALIGPSGSGKSTMLRLISRFYDPTAGRVLFGGIDEKEIEPEKLMQKISMVFQEVYLFQDTVANNIRYGKENASQEEVEAAARLANCYDFITEMPEGFETIVGEGGSTLSGGEKQRISIARAILKDAPVVLLDEATASLDPENEAQIQQAISRLIKDRTVVVIAHRLKTIQSANQIIVLDKGRIVERGNHQELMKKESLYSRLWKLQMQTKDWKIK